MVRKPVWCCRIWMISDRLQSRFGGDVAFVVDACQARITTQAIHDYLARDIIVFLTGSKFMGGPPFSGFALLPNGMAGSAAPLASGMATVFRRAEVPTVWAGAESLTQSGNAGLALRLSASLFELERFQKLSIDRVTRVVSAFNQAAGAMADQLRARKVAATPAEDVDEEVEHPIEMQTLVTLDLCHDESGAVSRTLDFDSAVAIHKAMTADGVRLGQPVRCVKLADGRWGATLRVGLSMPQVVRLDGVGDAEMIEWLQSAMDRIAAALEPRLG
jgi:selenocysteine lyase/cysteine desulfurase